MAASWFSLGLTDVKCKVEIGSSNATRNYFPLLGYIKTLEYPKGEFCRMSEKLPYKLLHIFISSYVCLMDPANLHGHPHVQNRA